MGFTVVRQGGVTDQDFVDYVRLLRQTGVDVGRARRVPEPGAGRHWLHVWDTEPEARAFAQEMEERMGRPGWEVVPVNGPPSEGPLGPLLLWVARRADDFTLALHPLGQALVRSAFPQVVGIGSFTMGAREWQEFRKAGGNLERLVRKVAPVVTGLTDEQLDGLGLVVLDDETGQASLYLPPRVPAQV